MFSSKTPRDLSHDPEPWRVTLGYWRNARTYAQIPESEYDPRPEYDHVQHNPPNPILVDFRQDYDGDMRGWGVWFALWLYQDPPGLGSPEHIEHARKVLQRLANLEAVLG